MDSFDNISEIYCPDYRQIVFLFSTFYITLQALTQKLQMWRL